MRLEAESVAESFEEFLYMEREKTGELEEKWVLFLLRCNSYAIKFTHVRWTVQWYLVCSQSCATIITT